MFRGWQFGDVGEMMMHELDFHSLKMRNIGLGFDQMIRFYFSRLPIPGLFIPA